MLFARSQIDGKGGSAHAGGKPKSGGKEKLNEGGKDGSPGSAKPHTETPVGEGAKEAAAAAAS